MYNIHAPKKVHVPYEKQQYIKKKNHITTIDRIIYITAQPDEERLTEKE